MGRKLASIQLVRELNPIVGADKIERVSINNWNVVSEKGNFQVGDKCVYFEIDSFLPIRDEFEFLRKSSYRKLADDTEGFRLRTIKLRGQVSQGLALPLHLFESYNLPLVVGTDVSEILGVIKYDPPLPAELAGKAKGNFPSFIPKTDEERVQNLTWDYENWKSNPELKFIETEKLDGTSATFYLNEGVFGVCSRNLELLEIEGNSFWNVVRGTNLEEKLRALGKNIAIQGELIGEGVQGNSYKLRGQEVMVFNVFDIDTQKYYDMIEFEGIVSGLGLKTVPIIERDFKLPDSIDTILEHVEGKSVLNKNANREGSVFRSVCRTVSFKSISNRFLLKEK